uniref:Aminopeptidase n=2 Tax=Chrysotila carterae TaxID=13221 RepID=A0A7S4F5X8_CHRCT
MDTIGGFATLCRCGKSACATHITAPCDDGRQLLPADAEPIAYALDIALRLDEHAFDGVVAVDVDVRSRETSSLTLHAKELNFKKASFEGIGDATNIALSEETSTVTFTFDKPLPLGNGKLSITYTGELNNQMAGFYRSSYVDRDGNTKLMASTQFEAIDARRCLPCWDEPRRKATFECSLRVPGHMTALSNMPEKGVEEHADGSKTVSFDRTPRMSTYLLAFVVGEFDAVEATSKNGVQIRVFCPPGKPQLGRFALECAVAALDSYDETFQIHYPLPKADMVAIPEFAAGAMENWGLVTYREVDLLIDDRSASSRQLQRVAEVVIHELAHQWFGNLVTMEWWDDLWLNEGFATWMETGVCHKLHPDWNMWEQFITDMQGRALSLDALRSSHPIQVPIAKAEEVEQVFDAISYCKGGSVVRMVHAILGEAKFVEGLRNYMSNFSYGNATTDDLWGAWEDVSGKPIRKLMGQWTRQMGFPLLELKAAEPQPDGSIKLSLHQSWFLSDGSAPSSSQSWTIPLFVTASGGANGEEKMDEAPLMPAEADFELNVKGDGAWFKLNAGQHVPMRVVYPETMVPNLASAVRTKSICAADRIGLLSDYAALARAGRVDPASYLELLAAYSAETDGTVWSMVLEQLGALRGILNDDETLSELFSRFARSMLLPKLAEIGWSPLETDEHLTRKLRGELISILSSFCANEPEVQAEARRRFDAFVADPSCSELPSEYQQAVYKLVLAGGGEAEFETLLRLFDTLALNEEKKSTLMGLGAAPTPELRTRALEFAISGKVKLQDFFYVSLSMHRASAAGKAQTWEFFKQNMSRYTAMTDKATSSILDAIIIGAISGFATEAKAAEVRDFFGANPLPRNERTITQQIEAIDASAKYLQRVQASTAKEWLESYLQK